jgi:putative transposase
LKKFEEGIFGDGKTPGTGLKPRPLEPEKLRMDLLPYVERSVQTYGFTHQNIHYYSDVLRTWIRARDPENSKKIRKFAFHYDPRSMKQHFFFDPTVRQYFPVPYRDTTRPDLSIWEIREAQKFLKKQGIEAVDEDAIFRAWERLRKIEAKAKSKTKKAKLDAHRRDRAASELVGTPGRDLASDALDHFPTGETGTPESIVAFEDLE